MLGFNVRYYILNVEAEFKLKKQTYCQYSGLREGIDKERL